MKKIQGTIRPWWWDALSAVAFLMQALIVGKWASRTLGPFAGLFVFLFNAGLAWRYGRAAWIGFQAALR